MSLSSSQNCESIWIKHLTGNSARCPRKELKERINSVYVILYWWIELIKMSKENIGRLLDISIKKSVNTAEKLLQVWQGVQFRCDDFSFLLVIHCAGGFLHPVETKRDDCFVRDVRTWGAEIQDDELLSFL